MRNCVRMLALGLAAAAALGAAPVATAANGDETVWLCHPSAATDPCRGNLDTSVLHGDGTAGVTSPLVPAAPPVDCFYVYPTVSNQLGATATKTADPEVKSIATYQAQRFSQQCRVFAPVYRQGTVVSIFNGGFTDASREVAYGDVLRAFKEYLAQDSRGRGFVLIGHSQGTGVLRRLIREQIDTVPALRKRLVSALLLGGNVLVKTDSDRGGDFQNVPLCRKDRQLGCVIAYSTFLDDPPDATRFGKPPTGVDRLTGLPPKAGLEVACTNPASLAANADSPFTTYVPSEPFAPGFLALGVIATFNGLPPTAGTPWIQPADRYAGRCATVNGANVLKVRQLPGARHLTAFPDSGWGLHLVDVNGAFGDLQRAVDTQSAAYLARLAAAKRAPRVSLVAAGGFGRTPAGLRCLRSATTVRIAGADRRKVARVDFGVRGKRVARDRTTPFSVRVARTSFRRGVPARVTAAVTLKDGRTRTVATTLRRCG
ncbi:hypothetical protein DSM112329_03592 [Paraconexibacter sp. AEG42_29]|uniref:DUF3089 domain-containing protein n=1 Tax=Paraconexibacter sp. AEG42_29 TaxID=2997339 RepID=A0AAU7AY89_9ACTN